MSARYLLHSRYSVRVAGAATALLAIVFAQPIYGATSGARADTPQQQWSAMEFSMQPQNAAAHPWSVRLDAAGSGTYTETGATSPVAIPVTVSPSTLERLRRGEHAARSGHCETRQKNIAQTGEKTIRYEFPDRAATCTFNYSEDAGLMDAERAFEAIAGTMQAGERLQHELRFDRLGLDAEMDTLVDAIHNGSAIELGNIAPVLHELVADEHVIDRVRRKAARLLQDPGSVASAKFDPNEP